MPPVTLIEGTITELGTDGFNLADASGSIVVRARTADGKPLDVSPRNTVKVYGNLRGGPEKVFDAYVIRKPSGEQIMISDPTPHFGFVIQSSFK